MIDTVEAIGRSIIQHGPHSDRVYVMKLHDDDMPGIVRDLANLAIDKRYTKIVAKVPERHMVEFKKQGYLQEAVVQDFFNGQETVYFMSRFLDDDRRILHEGSEHMRNIALAEDKRDSGIRLGPPSTLDLTPAAPEDTVEMSRIYAKVFPTYPFPIHDPDYLRRTMTENVRYYRVRVDGEIVALASAEMDIEASNVEMTDFATLPDHLGNGYALFLLLRMERDMEQLGIRSSYTIARSRSIGMNITFSKLGYNYAGTLVNNTNISGQIESMNVWSKPLIL